MFTKKSEQRIAKVVKRIEGTPVLGKVQPKRRYAGDTGASTPSSFDVTWVPVLPSIPTEEKTVKIVFWCSEDTWNEVKPEGDTQTGTGDDQMWSVTTNQTRWTPFQGIFTRNSGVVSE